MTCAAVIWAMPALSPWAVWLIAAALSLTVAAVVFAVARRLMTAVTGKMTSFAERLGGGDLNATVAASLPGNVAALGQALNAMAAGLKNTLGFAEGALNCLSESFPFLSLDAACRISHISPMLLRLLDIDGEGRDYLGKTPGELFYRDPNRSTTSLEALKQNKKIERETTLVTVKGNSRIVKVSANPVHDCDGELIGSLTIYFDLTQIKENEKSLAARARFFDQIVRESTAIANEVNDASGKLAALITDANADAKRLLEQAGESATAMEQMNATVLEVAKNSMGAASMAKDSSDKASGGAQTVERLAARIAAVDAVIANLKNRVRQLDSQADDIGKIMDMIGDIADQTNLLALNAAIEAARAGDAGRGFAVVADEVRKLAEKTMSATGEVGSVVSAIQDSVKSAASEMEDASKAIGEVTERARDSGSALAEILDLAGQTSGQVQSIATAAEEQSAAVAQINRTVEQTNTIAMHTTDSMNKAALSILSLAGKATDLIRVIERADDTSGPKDLDALSAGDRQKCWEFKKCGRENGGAKVAEMGVCPAWPDHGGDCAIVAGTFCGGTVQGDYASKIAFCSQCDYFKSEHHERDLVAAVAKGGPPANAARASGKAVAPGKTLRPVAPRKALQI